MGVKARSRRGGKEGEQRPGGIVIGDESVLKRDDLPCSLGAKAHLQRGARSRAVDRQKQEDVQVVILSSKEMTCLVLWGAKAHL